VTFTATTREIDRFRSAVTQRIGLQFDDARLDYLREVFQRRVAKSGRESAAYLQNLEYKQSDGEISALARELTVGETYFFRNHEQFDALAEIVLPERLRMRERQKTLRLLSAGCSSGEEAYSLAIVAREVIADPSWKVAIRAVDLNPAALEKAQRGRYSNWALRETPPDIQDKWFRADGREMVLDATIRAAVEFESGNLASDDPALWQTAAYDVIFCRNVLMYFKREHMRAAVARIVRSLAPGGFLFLGHAETLRGVSDEFHLLNSHNAFYYQLGCGDKSKSEDFIRLRASQPAPPPLPQDSSAPWYDAIRVASERVATLLPAVNGNGHAAHPAPPPAFDSTPILTLLREERFAEALSSLRVQSKTASPSPEILLLETALLVHSGQIADADDAAARLLLIDGDNAGAHYLLGLCREHTGDGGRAYEHHLTASQLDSSFAMPRLHLGMLAQRRGDHEMARGEFAQARALLAIENCSRILLFGGGFSRESLVALCESALKDCGSRS
jgi:chemotaxis protein methyltransferase CheR